MQAAVPVPHVAETATGLDSRKMLMWTFLGSECMFFGSLIANYLIGKGKNTTPPFPHEILNIPFTSVSSFVLLMSSLMMVQALSAIQRGEVHKFRVWTIATALLGLVFLGGQVYEFSSFVHEGLTLSTNLFGATFFVLTGFHGAHVSVGVLWLLSLLVASGMGKLRQQNSINVEVAALYWHFVDVVWIVIFTVVYLIP